MNRYEISIRVLFLSSVVLLILTIFSDIQSRYLIGCSVTVIILLILTHGKLKETYVKDSVKAIVELRESLKFGLDEKFIRQWQYDDMAKLIDGYEELIHSGRIFAQGRKIREIRKYFDLYVRRV